MWPCAETYSSLSKVPPMTGDEPSLLLNPILGGYRDDPTATHMPATLPEYSQRPEPLPHDSHCALCLQVCPMPSPPLQSLPEHRGVHPAVLLHAQTHHNLKDADAYRRAILSRVKDEWPTPVTAQVQRLCIDRYLERLRDCNYTMSFCSCCACVEYEKDLVTCEFPHRSQPKKPSWIDIDQKKWVAKTPSGIPTGHAMEYRTFGEVWFDKVDELLNVVSYEDSELFYRARELPANAPTHGASFSAVPSGAPLSAVPFRACSINRQAPIQQGP